MTEIVSLDEHRPHDVGPVVCTRCSYSWVAVRPRGVMFLECPKCSAQRGASFMTMVTSADEILGDECCGQVDSAGTCCAPACIRGTALNLIDSIRLAYFLEHGDTR
ncbi:hypothetical protein [Microcystis phage Mwe-JY08]